MILKLTLAIKLSDLSDTERQNLATDLGVPVDRITRVERTSPGRISAAIADFLKRESMDLEIFAAPEIYAEINGVEVVSAAFCCD
jgi:hypothetical protein